MKPRTGLILHGIAITCSVLVCSLVALLLQSGKVSGANDEYKIGIVDLQRVVDEYGKHKTEAAKLKTELDAAQAKIDDREAALKKAKEDYDKVRDTMAEDARAKKESELQNQLLELQSEAKKAEADLQMKQGRLRKTVLEDLVKAINEIGAAEDYHLILEADPESRTGVMYHSATLDMTQKVIDRLNGSVAPQASATENKPKS